MFSTHRADRSNLQSPLIDRKPTNVSFNSNSSTSFGRVVLTDVSRWFSDTSGVRSKPRVRLRFTPNIAYQGSVGSDRFHHILAISALTPVMWRHQKTHRRLLNQIKKCLPASSPQFLPTERLYISWAHYQYSLVKKHSYYRSIVSFDKRTTKKGRSMCRRTKFEKFRGVFYATIICGISWTFVRGNLSREPFVQAPKVNLILTTSFAKQFMVRQRLVSQ